MITILEAARIGPARVALRRRWAERKRNYLRARRLRLIMFLGGKCIDCPQANPARLEFDHIEPRRWSPRKTWSNKRLAIYEVEAAQGKLVLRCRSCNASRGEPIQADDDGEWSAGP